MTQEIRSYTMNFGPQHPAAHGVLRLSFVHYTSQAEVDQLIGALDRVL